MQKTILYAFVLLSFAISCEPKKESDSGKVAQSFTYYDQNPQPGATRNYFWQCN